MKTGCPGLVRVLEFVVCVDTVVHGTFFLIAHGLLAIPPRSFKLITSCLSIVPMFSISKNIAFLPRDAVSLSLVACPPRFAASVVGEWGIWGVHLFGSTSHWQYQDPPFQFGVREVSSKNDFGRTADPNKFFPLFGLLSSR